MRVLELIDGGALEEVPALAQRIKDAENLGVSARHQVGESKQSERGEHRGCAVGELPKGRGGRLLSPKVPKVLNGSVDEAQGGLGIVEELRGRFSAHR